MNAIRNALLMAIAVPALGMGTHASAEESADSPHSVTANMALVSDYRFRGISQTYEDPAIQGGIDYAHSSGLYLGTWASNVSGNQYLGGNGMEWDLYGGYKKAFSDVTLDLGLLYYYYPSSELPTANPAGGTEKYDTVEAYVGASWKWFTAKYSYALTDLFGVQESTYGAVCDRHGTDCFGAAPGDSEGSGYLDLGASVPLRDNLTLVAHAGHQSVSGYGKLDYTDWKLGVTYDLHGFILGAAWVDTDADDDWYYANGSNGIRELGGSTAVLSVSRAF